jgi:hypothetical protein
MIGASGELLRASSEFSGHTERRETLEYLQNWQLLKMGSAPAVVRLVTLSGIATAATNHFRISATHSSNCKELYIFGYNVL